jgi:hypothetical protein
MPRHRSSEICPCPVLAIPALLKSAPKTGFILPNRSKESPAVASMSVAVPSNFNAAEADNLEDVSGGSKPRP